MSSLNQSCFGPVLSVAEPNFPLHPLCTVWLQMPDMDFDRMVEDAKKMGGIINNPGVVWNGQILDGRNRQLVCQKLGFKFEYREFKGDYEAARAFVISMNFNRRHMTSSQRSMMVANLAAVDAKNGGEVLPATKLAVVAQVSPTQMQTAINLQKTGDEIAIERVLKGETTLHGEMKAVKRKLAEQGISEEMATGANIQRKNRIDKTEDLYADAMGRIVPFTLQEVWKIEGYFSILKDKLEQSRLELKTLMASPAGHALSDSYLQTLSDLMRDLDMKRPWYICPHCNGDKKCQCDMCKKKWRDRGYETREECYICVGHGWLPKDEPYPMAVWVREPRKKIMESADGRTQAGVPDGGRSEAEDAGGIREPESVQPGDMEALEVPGDTSGDGDPE